MDFPATYYSNHSRLTRSTAAMQHHSRLHALTALSTLTCAAPTDRGCVQLDSETASTPTFRLFMMTNPKAKPRYPSTNFTGNRRRSEAQVKAKDTTFNTRPRHPVPTDIRLKALFHQVHKKRNVQWADELRPNRRLKIFQGKEQLIDSYLEKGQGQSKKQRMESKLTNTRRTLHPRQGQGTRLCRDATNKAIVQVAKATMSREKFKPNQSSKLSEYRCRCKCVKTCKHKSKHLNHHQCTPVADCKCHIRSGCIYLIGCKDKTTRKQYIGEAVDPFTRFQHHTTNAFSDFDRMGKDMSRLEEAIRLSGHLAHKKWFMLILQDVPKLLGETKAEWTLRRRAAEREWMQ